MADLLYGPDGPTESDIRLVGAVAGKRVLDLGCGDGAAAVTLAQQGAVVIAVDASEARLQRASRRAEELEVRLEWRPSDLADLAFLRADSIDVVFSAYAVDTVGDQARLFRQVQRVLKPNAAFVFSHAHPAAIARDYFDTSVVTTTRFDEAVTVYPRPFGETFTDLARAGFRVDALLEPRSPAGANPTTVVWRARKEGS
ncbi:MAG TPA: class I SAM-dependent methyltransferase [Acidimicrobiia bacterium]|jgi:ubiquinone/menaquinone biosynthesis C-methylase UbiE